MSPLRIQIEFSDPDASTGARSMRIGSNEKLSPLDMALLLHAAQGSILQGMASGQPAPKPKPQLLIPDVRIRAPVP